MVDLDADGTYTAADHADAARLLRSGELPPLHVIPVLSKDSIAAAGNGRVSRVGRVPLRNAGMVKGLRRASALILGTASLNEWYNFRAGVPNSPSIHPTARSS